MASSPSHPSAPPGLQHSYGPEMAGPDHLQNSFGPEVAASEYHMGYGPQAVAVGGLDAAAVPGQQQQVAASPALGYSTYAEQAEKNNEYSGGGGEGAAAGPVTPRKRILGLPLWGFWLLVALAIVVLALAFGVGLGVGLSQQSSSSGSDSASAVTSSSSSSSTTTPVSATTATPTSSTASTTKTSSTSSSTSAAATSVRVEICQNAYLDSCTTITVPASSCINFQSAYNNSISSVDTGGPSCSFYTDSSCAGDYWLTSGSQDLIPAEFNDAFSSVTCED